MFGIIIQVIEPFTRDATVDRPVELSERPRTVIRSNSQMAKSFQHPPFFLLSFSLCFVSLGLVFHSLDYFVSFFTFGIFFVHSSLIFKIILLILNRHCLSSYPLLPSLELPIVLKDIYISDR